MSVPRTNAEQVRAIVAATSGTDPDEVTDADLEPLIALLEVRPEYLHAALETVQVEVGVFDGYLRDGLGVTDEQVAAFRDAMLE